VKWSKNVSKNPNVREEIGITANGLLRMSVAAYPAKINAEVMQHFARELSQKGARKSKQRGRSGGPNFT